MDCFLHFIQLFLFILSRNRHLVSESLKHATTPSNCLSPRSFSTGAVSVGLKTPRYFCLCTWTAHLKYFISCVFLFVQWLSSFSRGSIIYKKGLSWKRVETLLFSVGLAFKATGSTADLLLRVHYCLTCSHYRRFNTCMAKPVLCNLVVWLSMPGVSLLDEMLEV